ncbi:MerR family transcriptional regulator [Aerococcaceae bacterium zg-BR22]|uniref:MerR family transcriptional regulator n=1 Tax=Aerococcaceae bacterium zg-1292 TaxID=2774330 RepID=UPI004063C631|nr:MerR family transcriptional regulator [Aerococcaceae bacterium zg-BR22]
MLRHEVQSKTGLIRKAIEYYEDKGLISPHKSENGYREYSEEDLNQLTKIAMFRKLGLDVAEIKECLTTNDKNLAVILREKEYRLSIEQHRAEILALIVQGENQLIINQKLALIETQETIYESLLRAFPGYFGQLLFAAYEPFLNQPLTPEGKAAYREYIAYLDSLPSFSLSKDEQEYVEEVSSKIDRKMLKDVNRSKIDAVENAHDWLMKNQEAMNQYHAYLKSNDYLNSPMKSIQEKLLTYVQQNNYYERAIPLIRQFSQPYDDYYKKLLQADEQYKQTLM